MMFRDECDFQDFIDHFKAGDFDDHLFDTIGRLSAEDLVKVAEALQIEELSKSRQHIEFFSPGTVSPLRKEAMYERN